MDLNILRLKNFLILERRSLTLFRLKERSLTIYSLLPVKDCLYIAKVEGVPEENLEGHQNL